ncbi:hypothetical protein CU098_004260 [Rhizopus stolonifer]|uniref:Uncharacterized protein n=1 Tax=Rhizopus stolonifer TaxID=4846 RepID=A0A367IQX9_RHIST|nr:hypothetical protein CU098_004260 [Rhizopus stolonifer]
MGHILTKFHNEKENDNQYSKKSNNGPTDSEESNSITPVYSVPTESSSLRNREFHMEEEASYWLPKDEDEQLRLMGDMASTFPNCTFDCCDIVDVINTKIMPGKIKFSYGNLVKGLSYADNTFDFVQIRFFVYALTEKEWPLAIMEALRVTKVGGLVQLMEHDIKDHGDINPTYQFTDAVHKVSKARGQDTRIGKELERLVKEIETAKFVQVESKVCDLSGKNATSRKFAWNWREVASSMMPAVAPHLGLKTSEDEKHFLKELANSLKTNKYYYRVYAVIGQKLKD